MLETANLVAYGVFIYTLHMYLMASAQSNQTDIISKSTKPTKMKSKWARLYHLPFSRPSPFPNPFNPHG